MQEFSTSATTLVSIMPEENEDIKPRVILRIDGTPAAKYIMSLPFVGFVACVALSIVYDFERSTATHCNVRI